MIPSSLSHLDLPPGDLRAITLHWTAGDYVQTFDAYHFCVRGAEEPLVCVTRDLRDNMRDVRLAPDAPYAAHAAGRNAYNAGIAACAMASAAPADFGAFPITAAQVEMMCSLAARVARRYEIPLAAIRTHAELAIEDGYFGADADDLRWDVARLTASSAPVGPVEARTTAERLRARIAALMQNEDLRG